MSKQLSKKNDGNAEMSFWEHLEELRWHLIRSSIAVLIITIATFLLKNQLFDYLILAPKSADFLTYKALCSLSEKIGLGQLLCIEPARFEIINYDLPGQFLVHLKVSLVLGFIISFPYIAFEMWRFIKPALYKNEKRYAELVVFSTSMLFLSGVLFGYFVLAPFSINFFASYQVSLSVSNMIALVSYISIITTVVLAGGIMFELPMVVYVLSKLGLLTPEMMREYRKHAVIAILATAAIITPADVWTQFLVSVPVYFLYEISILLSARVVKKDQIQQK